ncbi:MAG TPA: IS1182 family transposase [Atribacterota bacterium]|nr:IS1182 family transposase [Atribacterota bacterium]HOR42992.1 IS1182 family transposase [Atribacterota bacterium]
MAYRYGNDRCQGLLFPPSVDESIKANDPVRAYDAFIEALDLVKIGFDFDPHKVGNPKYYPVIMLKVLVYGYSYGIRSSRKIERALHHNLSFIWLARGLKPDHKTIAEFRRKYCRQLAKVLKQCARICIRLNLIEGNTLFLDGSKFRGNASIKNSWDKKKAEAVLAKVDQRIKELLTECERVDQSEEQNGSLIRMGKELEDQKHLKAKVAGILKELEEENKKSLNTTDPDSTRINSPTGSNAGYSLQSVVDDKHGLILSSDVVSVNNDLYQFAKQIDEANRVLNKKCKVACADSGYATTGELAKIDEQDILVVVPTQRQASRKEPSLFAKELFFYDKSNDCYICPEGHTLTFRSTDEKNKYYKITDYRICLSCQHYGTCTRSGSGRGISRLLQEEIRQRLEAQYLEPESQAIYKRRKEKVELPFGHIKRNLKADFFLLRGLHGVKAEASLLCTCFNLARMVTIFGVPGLVQILKNI